MLTNICHDWNDNFEQLHVRYEESLKAIFFEMRPAPLPSFTPRLLEDLLYFQQVVARYIEQDAKGTERNVEYLVFASGVPNIFQLGGDLQFFLDCIQSGDRETLAAYARLSIDVLHNNYSNLNLPVTTISLVQGKALGAGFEAALSSDFIIAERNVEFQFPEVVFNMFPGMGAYSFLARRTDTALVEQMIRTGRAYNAEEMAEKGVIDHIAEQGEGMQALRYFITRHRRSATTQNAVLKMRDIVFPVTKEELLKIADLWVDSAMSLPASSTKAMARIVRAQMRRIAPAPAAEIGSTERYAESVG